MGDVMKGFIITGIALVLGVIMLVFVNYSVVAGKVYSSKDQALMLIDETYNRKVDVLRIVEAASNDSVEESKSASLSCDSAVSALVQRLDEVLSSPLLSENGVNTTYYVNVVNNCPSSFTVEVSLNFTSRIMKDSAVFSKTYNY